MKKYIVIISCLFSFNNSFCQQQALEEYALERALSYRDSILHKKDTVIYVNREIESQLLPAYFSNRQSWHIQGFLQSDCYGTEDSVKNAKFAKGKRSLRVFDKRLRPIENKLLKDIQNIKFHVYKRFYYCNKVYVLIFEDNIFTLIKTQILVAFDLDGNFLSLAVHSYVI